MSEIGPMRPEDPARLGPYTLIGRLGRGGYGVVYLAETADAERVAVKLLETAMADAGDERDRFAREAAAAKQVARFCTAQVIDADVAGDRPYIVSEYVPGPSLHALVTERGPLEGGVLDRLAIGTATALVAIHQAGVVHRDLKPPNVLIGPDGPRVIDFGIARMMGHAATLTGQTLGTPAYMAPEQVRGEEVTAAADVFAWGATVVYAATGTPPFGRDSIAVLAHRIAHGPPELGTLTGSLRDLVAECLRKDPARRPSAGVLLMRLLGHPAVPGGERSGIAILAEGVTAAAVPPVSAGPPTRPVAAVTSPPTRVETAPQAAPKRRHWAQAVAGMVTALALAGAAVLAVVAFRDRDGSPAPGPTVTVSARGTTTPARQAPPPVAGASSSRPGRPAPQPGFTVQPGACDLGDTGLSCAVTLSGTGAAFTWTATAADPLSLSSSSGSLNPGETVTVTITLSPPSPRVAGAGTATFTGAGHARTVRVTWQGTPDPDPSSS
ncbi:MAG: serine/threonine protein kinase [Actinoallomurus sp.]|jgi:predicted Ser/Thr protein kinase|nr:serine/threonine protein kinase [Actinoallomurus sp.]